MKKNWTWESIVDVLIQEFQENIYKKGDKMPSENKMAVRFGVPRSEIRKAYERLKELGYIYAMQGYGVFFPAGGIRFCFLWRTVVFPARWRISIFPLRPGIWDARNCGVIL